MYAAAEAPCDHRLLRWDATGCKSKVYLSTIYCTLHLLLISFISLYFLYPTFAWCPLWPILEDVDAVAARTRTHACTFTGQAPSSHGNRTERRSTSLTSFTKISRRLPCPLLAHFLPSTFLPRKPVTRSTFQLLLCLTAETRDPISETLSKGCAPLHACNATFSP